jgi:hypothetical protein
MDTNPIMAYFLAIVAGVGFALIARQAGRSIGLWGVSGALFGLFTSTIVLGLGHAIAVPYSDVVVAKYYWVSVLLAALLIGLVAAVSFWALNRGNRPAMVAPVESAQSPKSGKK